MQAACSASTFTEHHLVTNGCVEQMAQVFSPEVGSHACSAFGVAQVLWQHFVAAASSSCKLTLADRIMAGLRMLRPAPRRRMFSR